MPAAVAAHALDVVLMDIRMPGVDGLAATEALRARRGAPGVIVLTTFDADEHVLRALRAGASGFLLKDTPPPDIVHAIRLVAAGEAMLSPAITRRLVEHVAGTRPDPQADRARELLARLTDREREVATAIGHEQAGQVGERRLGRIGLRAVGALAQDADDLAQVLERLVCALGG